MRQVPPAEFLQLEKVGWQSSSSGKSICLASVRHSVQTPLQKKNTPFLPYHRLKPESSNLVELLM
jgi:hypothetical protein